MSDFQLFKLALVDLVGLSKDALHVYVGMSAFLMVALFTGPRHRKWLPFACAAALAVAGEAWDLIETYGAGETLRWDLSAQDVVNTVFWPGMLTMLLPIFARTRPNH